ncbi:MAG: beta-ketoacyl-[acyl-carrier-protein] synthase family protein [Planctomycetaceae bacterium]|nr:beta-ketoacyl-[acyl-carrier-protein] synthase family protein [Planctomycetaceae bacterium]
MDDAVWITGIGTVTPLGNSLNNIAASVLAGRSATRQVFDRQGDNLVPFVGAEVDQVPVPSQINADSFAALPKLQQMALWSAAAALEDAGLSPHIDQLRIGVVLGQGGEWYRQWLGDWQRQGDLIRHPERKHQTLVSFVQGELSLAGPTASVGSACASANFALELGRQWVRRGLVDVCLAGSSEIACPITRANFHNLRALSRNLADPEHASRPFDADRDGFVMGEGAAIFVLESASSARRRGAPAYAEVAGFGASSDAAHMVIPSDNPVPAAAAIEAALASARVEPQQIDYVNAHATSTTVGDRAEARALRLVFGSHTATTPVSSTKSMTGHLVSAAAAIEAVICIAALQRQAVPPTINLDNPDPDCDLCHVRNQAIDTKVRVTLSNSFGFGGSNTSLVLKRVA